MESKTIEKLLSEYEEMKAMLLRLMEQIDNEHVSDILTDLVLECEQLLTKINQ